MVCNSAWLAIIMGATVNRSSALFGVTPSIAQPRLTSDASPGAHPWVCVWVVHSGTILLNCPVHAQLSRSLARSTQLWGNWDVRDCCIRTDRPAAGPPSTTFACTGCGVPCVNWLTIHRLHRVWCTLRKLAHHPLAIITPPNLISHAQGNIIPSTISDQPACHFSSHACQFACLSALTLVSFPPQYAGVCQLAILRSCFLVGPDHHNGHQHFCLAANG